MVGPSKKIITLNIYIDINVLYERLLTVKVWYTTKCLLKCYIFYKNVRMKNILWLTQAPNTSEHIFINKEATMKISRKNSSWQSLCFYNFSKNGIFYLIIQRQCVCLVQKNYLPTLNDSSISAKAPF